MGSLLAIGVVACQAEEGEELVDVEAGEEEEAGVEGGSQGTTIMPPRPLAGTDGLLLQGNDLWIAMSASDAVVVIDVRTGDIKRVVASEADPDAIELAAPDDIWRDPVTGDIYISQVGDGTGGHVDRISPNGTRRRLLTRFGDNNSFPNGITGIHRPGQPARVFIAPVNFFGSKTGIFEIDVNGVNPPTLVYGAQNNVDVFGTGIPGGGNGMVFDAAGRELFTPTTFGGAVLAIDVAAHTARVVWNGNGPTARGVYVRFTADGRSLLFTEHSSGRVFRLNPAGPATQTPQLVAQLDIGIDGLAVAPDGRIFVSNFVTGGIGVIRPNGQVQQLVTRSMNIPNGIDDMPDGRLLVGDIPSLAIVDPRRPGQLPVRPKFFIDGDITQGVANASACDTYVTTYFRRNIQHFNTCTLVPNQATNITPFFSFAMANDLALAGQTLYISDAGGSVWRLAVSGATPGAPVQVATGLAKPSGIAVAYGQIYVSEFNANQIRVLDATTGAVVRTVTGVSGPEGLAIHPDGSILVVESHLGKLTRIRADGSRRTVASNLGTQVLGLVTPLVNMYSDVLLKANGKVVVTEPLTGSIREFSL